MQRVSEYLKLKVLAAIDMAEGKNYRSRTRAVAQMGFEDERGVLKYFTWRAIETWRVRYQKHGITVMCPKPRSDKGHTRKVEPEHRALMQPHWRRPEHSPLVASLSK